MKVQVLIILLVKIILSESANEANPRNVQLLDLSQINASSPNTEKANENEENANVKSWTTTAAPRRLTQNVNGNQQRANWQNNNYNAQGYYTGTNNNWQRSSGYNAGNTQRAQNNQFSTIFHGNQNDQHTKGIQVQNLEYPKTQHTQGHAAYSTEQGIGGTEADDRTEDSYLAAFQYSQQNLREKQETKSQDSSTLETSATASLKQGNDQDHKQSNARPGAYAWKPRTVDSKNQNKASPDGQSSATRPGAYTWTPKNTNTNQQNSGLSTNQNGNTRSGTFTWKPISQINVKSQQQQTASTTLRPVASTTATTFSWQKNSNWKSNLGSSSALTINTNLKTSNNDGAVQAFRLTPISNYNKNSGVTSSITNANAGSWSWQGNSGTGKKRNTFTINDSNGFERLLSALSAGGFTTNEELILVVNEKKIASSKEANHESG